MGSAFAMHVTPSLRNPFSLEVPKTDGGSRYSNLIVHLIGTFSSPVLFQPLHGPMIIPDRGLRFFHLLVLFLYSSSPRTSTPTRCRTVGTSMLSPPNNHLFFAIISLVITP